MGIAKWVGIANIHTYERAAENLTVTSVSVSSTLTNFGDNLSLIHI